MVLSLSLTGYCGCLFVVVFFGFFFFFGGGGGQAQTVLLLTLQHKTYRGDFGVKEF